MRDELTRIFWMGKHTDRSGDLTRHECGFQHEGFDRLSRAVVNGTEQEIVRGMVVRGMRIFNTKIAKGTKLTKVRNER